MGSGGVGQTGIGNRFAVTELGVDFFRRVGRVHGRFEAWQFEPPVAEKVFESYVDADGVVLADAVLFVPVRCTLPAAAIEQIGNRAGTARLFRPRGVGRAFPAHARVKRGA